MIDHFFQRKGRGGGWTVDYGGVNDAVECFAEDTDPRMSLALWRRSRPSIVR